jgi:splicing factor 45
LSAIYDFKKKDDLDDMPAQLPFIQPPRESKGAGGYSDPEWNVRDAYDPMWPNDYEQIMKERRGRREKEREEERKREMDERFTNQPLDPNSRTPDQSANRRGFQQSGTRKRTGERYRERDDDRRPGRMEEPDDDYERPRRPGNVGAAIAPPPSLLEELMPKQPFPSPNVSGSNLIPSLGGSIAAKIMAKYGFKEGQGLGRLEQGMSQALQVEKTSKRGGKIIHERDISKGESGNASPPSPPRSLLFGGQPAPAPTLTPNPHPNSSSNPDPTNVTQAMKNPSKVVLLQNMVGPGEVDDDLEPEVKEECAKYGEVTKCLIFEIPGAPAEEAVRIFVEFKRIESAIKAVVDLNGRFFGGRRVKGGFYNQDRFRRLDLVDI